MRHTPVHDLTPAAPSDSVPAGLAGTLAALIGLRADAGVPGTGSQLTYIRTERFELSKPDADAGLAGRSIRYACEHHVTVAPPRPNPFARPRVIAAVAAALALTGGAIGYGLRDPAPQRRPHSVTILLSPPRAAVPSAPAQPPTAMNPKPILAPPGPLVAPPVAHTPALAAPAAKAPPRTVDAAINAALVAAFATNEMQNWEAGEKSGAVVVGPATIAGGTTCRDVAILTRSDGGKDTTVNSHRCQSRDGRISPAQAAAASIEAPPPVQPPVLAYDLPAADLR